MAEPPAKQRALAKKKKGNDAEGDDPVNGVKFDGPELDNEDQVAALKFRGKTYVQVVVNNSQETRAKAAVSVAYWIDSALRAHVPQTKGKHFVLMGTSGKTEDGKPTVWLFAEETLWMVEHGHIQLLDPEDKPISRRWLWERLFCNADVVGFTPQHYAAYAHLRNTGYVARRWNRKAPSPEMSAQDPSCWDRVMTSEGGIVGGYVVFEVWPPSMAAGFKRKDPPRSHWKLLPWKLDSDCFPAEAWSKVAGAGSMVALSGYGGTRCSFFQVMGTLIEKNLSGRVEAPQQGVAKRERKMGEEVERGSSWYPTVEQWREEVK